MTVWRTFEEAQADQALDMFGGDPAVVKTCTYCRRQLFYPIVYWMIEYDLFLHPACAVQLAIKLIGEVRDCERTTKIHVIRDAFTPP